MVTLVYTGVLQLDAMNQLFAHLLSYYLLKISSGDGPKLCNAAADLHGRTPSLVKKQGPFTKASATTKGSYVAVVHQDIDFPVCDNKEGTANLGIT